MRQNGWSVLRFWHADVLRDRKSVLETIIAVLDGRLMEPVATAEMRFVPRDISACARSDIAARPLIRLPAPSPRERGEERSTNDR